VKLYKYRHREEYVDEQVVRSQKKFGYCKVFIDDIFRYRQVLQMDAARRGPGGGKASLYPVLALGVRSGAEVDLFRAGFFGPLLRLGFLQSMAARYDHSTDARRKMRLARILGFGAGPRRDGRVTGVEINPDCQREDVFVGSFDELPAGWAQKYRVIFSNSFDHAMDPEKTVAEWKRVAAPGAYAIIAFTPQKTPSKTDPLGGLSFNAVHQLWGAPIVFATETLNHTGYYEICFRL
jgi:hypothetical protein